VVSLKNRIIIPTSNADAPGLIMQLGPEEPIVIGNALCQKYN
jgi:hypothetical protein